MWQLTCWKSLETAEQTKEEDTNQGKRATKTAITRRHRQWWRRRPCLEFSRPAKPRTQQGSCAHPRGWNLAATAREYPYSGLSVRSTGHCSRRRRWAGTTGGTWTGATQWTPFRGRSAPADGQKPWCWGDPPSHVHPQRERRRPSIFTYDQHGQPTTRQVRIGGIEVSVPPTCSQRLWRPWVCDTIQTAG